MIKKLCLLLAFLLVFSLFGCESNTDREDGDDRDRKDEETATLSPRETLEEALNAFTGRKCHGYAVILGNDGQPAVPQNTGIAQLLSSYVTYKLGKISTDADTGTAQVTITAPDSAALLKTATEHLETLDEEALCAQVEALLQQDPALCAYQLEVQLQRVEDTWCVIIDFPLSNALTGGLTQAYLEMQQQLMDQLKEGGAAE